MLAYVDLFPVGQLALQLFGQYGAGGKAANELQARFAQMLDAALIAAAQAVEHYEMTRYGTLIAWARQLGRADVATLLLQTLDEERTTDKKLTLMAEAQVNRKAA